MAKAMVRKAIADRIPFRWVTADAAYGFSKGWRFELEQADVFHVMATTRHDTVVTRSSHRSSCPRPVPRPATAEVETPLLRRRGPRPARVRLGPRRGAALAPGRPPALGHRPPQRPPSEEISYYIAYCPADTTLDELIQIAGNRWAVEECFQTAKQECGLDDYQVRRYPGWHRHMTLAMAAHACLTVLRARELDADKAGNGSSHLIHYSVAGCQTPDPRLTHRWPTPVDHILHWSTWRRRRQHQARVSHYKRRGHST